MAPVVNSAVSEPSTVHSSMLAGSCARICGQEVAFSPEAAPQGKTGRKGEVAYSLKSFS